MTSDLPRVVDKLSLKPSAIEDLALTSQSSEKSSQSGSNGTTNKKKLVLTMGLKNRKLLQTSPNKTPNGL